MNTICLFGGGRWSRVLLSVLHKSFPNIGLIIWVTKHGYTQNVEWLQNQNILNVKIVQHEHLVWNYKPQAVILANASYLHGKYLKEAILRQIPVLSEKPFCLSVSEGNKLALLCKQHQVAAGVNFEFTYASYLESFRKYLTQVTINSIDITWQDPFCEKRHGEQKTGDIYTPLMYDSFQHCWSMLHFLLPNESLTLHDVSYNVDSSVLIDISTPSKCIAINLSRRATERKRIISVNHGAIILDFSIEPGLVTIDKRVIQNEWTGNRPLLAVFNSFFEVINNPKLLADWPLYIGNCLDVVHLSAQANDLLEKSQQDCLARKEPLSALCVMTRNLLVDMFLPKLTMAGKYHRAHNLQEEVTFCEYIIKMIS